MHKHKMLRTAANLSRQIYFFFYSVYRPCQDYFTHIETSQSVGGAKREYRRKTTWHTRKQNLACLTCCQCGALGRFTAEIVESSFYFLSKEAIGILICTHHLRIYGGLSKTIKEYRKVGQTV